MSPIRDEYELIEHPAWGLFHWNTHEIHLAWHKSTIIIISKVKMVRNITQKYLHSSRVLKNFKLYPLSQVQVHLFEFVVWNGPKTIKTIRNITFLVNFLFSVQVWFIVGRGQYLGCVHGHTEGHSDMVRSFILYLSIFSTNQDWASAHFAFFNWFVPVSQVQPRLTSLPMPRRENQKLSS